MNELIYRAVLNVPPRTKKNSQQIFINKKTGKPFITQSALYKQYETTCGYLLRKPRKPINEPIEVKCLFYKANNIRMDLTNALEAIDDILVKYGIIADDNFKIIVSHDGSRILVDKENPRTEIYIYKHEGE